jgi:hypothetical protein
MPRRFPRARDRCIAGVPPTPPIPVLDRQAPDSPDWTESHRFRARTLGGRHHQHALAVLRTMAEEATTRRRRRGIA